MQIQSKASTIVEAFIADKKEQQLNEISANHLQNILSVKDKNKQKYHFTLLTF